MYKIIFHHNDERDLSDDQKRLKFIALHLMEIPYERNWADEWEYLPNWHARRDRNCMSTEAYNRQQERDLKKHNLLAYMVISPLWDQSLEPETVKLLDELQAEGRAIYDDWSKTYCLTNSGRAYLEGRELPDIYIPPYEA